MYTGLNPNRFITRSIAGLHTRPSIALTPFMYAQPKSFSQYLSDKDFKSDPPKANKLRAAKLGYIRGSNTKTSFTCGSGPASDLTTIT